MLPDNLMERGVRTRVTRWGDPQRWSVANQAIGLALFIALGAGATLLLPHGYGPALICGLLFFLFSLIHIQFGVYVVIVAMLLSPEVAIGETAQREITVRVEDFLIFGLLGAKILRSILDARLPVFRNTPLNRPIYSYVFFALFSTVWGISLGHVEARTSVFYFMKVCQFFILYLLTVSCIDDEKTLKRYMSLFLFTGLLIGVYGMLQVGKVDRVTAPFEGGQPEPNTLGGYLTVIISISLAIFLYAPRENLYYRMLSALVTILCFVTMLFTLSRASFLGFLFMLVCMGVVSRRYILIYAVAAMLVLAPLALPQDVIDRVNYTFTGPPGSEISFFGLFSINVDTSTRERIDIWQKVGYLFIRSPLWGYGLTKEHILDSQFARLLVEVGAVGVGLFIWILFRMLRCAWYVFRKSRSWFYQALALGYLAAYGGILVHSFGTITFYIVRIMEPFWFFTGILIYIYLLEKSREFEAVKAPAEVGFLEPRRRTLTASGRMR